jgi:hypothetical protein
MRRDHARPLREAWIVDLANGHGLAAPGVSTVTLRDAT